MAETAKEATTKPTAPAPSAATVWDSFRTEMNDLFDRFGGFSLIPTLRRPAAWPFPTAFGPGLPACDFVEDERGFKITAELPGLTDKEVELSLSGDTLTIKGEKSEEKEEKKSNYYLSERSYGSFQRSFQLPKSADKDKVDAAFSKGVLTVTLPKLAPPAENSKKVEIKSH
ncbi:MAG TPA: Hsp20/alpha crystallin family protein [Stellaceae bacterium]|nr:Hsp20/alpha crystallin family protein [Stellaceae bacterium]